MNNQSTEKDEKKGGALPPWMTGSARVGSGLGSGGSSAAGSGLARFLGLLAGPKAIVAMTVAGGLAMGMGIVATISEPQQPSLAQRFHNQKVKTDAPSSSLPGMPGEYKSALNMAQQANTGFFADPNAAAAAAGEQVAESASDAPADTDPAAPEGTAKGATAEGDPQDLAAAFAGQKNTKAGMGNGKFGKLSSGTGGGMRLAGGSGMSGGIGGTFKQQGLTNSKMGEMRAMSGANRAQVTRGKMSSANLGKSALKGATGKRLDNMNRAMGNAATGNATQAASTHAQQWDAAAPTGAGISGAGAGGVAGGGQFSGEEGMGGGGPLDTGSNNSSYSPNDVKDVGPGSNQTPYQNQLMMAQGLLMLASVIVLVVGICAMMEKTPFTAWIASIKMALYAAAIGMAAAAAAIGATISSQYGQAGQGKIIAIGGTITAATAAMALAAPTMPSWVLVLGGIAGLAASLSGMLKK